MSLTAAQLDAFKKRLLEMRGELDDLSQISADARRPVTLDQTSVGRLSRMDAMQGQAMQLETERRRKAERQRIEVALERLDDGSFGYCAVCDEDIAIKRLEHDPSVATCIDCQRGRG